jgi:hypothetical protein
VSVFTDADAFRQIEDNGLSTADIPGARTRNDGIGGGVYNLIDDRGFNAHLPEQVPLCVGAAAGFVAAPRLPAAQCIKPLLSGLISARRGRPRLR